MAARSRPRALQSHEADAHEERDLWSKIVNDLKDRTRQSKRINEVADEIAALEAKYEGSESEMTLKDMDALEQLYEEQMRLSDDESDSLRNVIEINDLLIALRTATESGDRGGVSQQKRIKRKHDESMSADSPSSRNPKIQRSNSAAPTDGFQMNAEVAYRLPKQKGAEYEWIQCTITGILGGDGIKRKYEVQDPEPDEAGGHGTKYKALASALIPIPRESANLPPYPPGKQVLARYPETTTFYRAEVMGTKRDGTCRLKFDGEEEEGKETEVERRLVLDVGDKR